MLLLQIQRNKAHSLLRDTKPVDLHKTVQLERIRSHHQILEQRYVDNEIDKFRKSLHSPKRTEFVVRLNNYQSRSSVGSANSNIIKPNNTNYNKKDMFKRYEETKLYQEYDFDTPQSNETYSSHSDEDIRYIQRSHPTKTTTIDSEGVYEIQAEVIDPFDNVVDQNKVVRFEYVVKDTPDAEEESNSDCSLPSLPTTASLDVFSSVICNNKIQRKLAPPLQLIGKQIDVPLDVSTQNKTIRNIEKTVCLPKTEPNIPVLSVTKINTDQLFNSDANKMSVTLIPKRTEIAIAKNEIIADLFCSKQTITTSDDMYDILHRYFRRWYQFTTAAKVAGDSGSRDESRQRKINTFLQTIRQVKQKQTNNSKGLNTTKNAKEAVVALSGISKNQLNSK